MIVAADVVVVVVGVVVCVVGGDFNVGGVSSSGSVGVFGWL